VSSVDRHLFVTRTVDDPRPCQEGGRDRDEHRHLPEDERGQDRSRRPRLPIDRRRFLFLVQETPFFAINVMQVLAERLRKLLAGTEAAAR
jgi:hypothetical protein